MANMSFFDRDTISLTTIILFSVPITIITILIITNLLTTLRYRLSLSRFKHAASKTASPSPPPQYPYTIPLLGHALSWTNTSPGSFFRAIQPHFHSSVGIITLLLAGNTAHIVNSPTLITKLFKVKSLSRERFNRDIMVKAMGLSPEDDVKAYGKLGEGKKRVGPGSGAEMSKYNHDINMECLMNQNAVNILTETFLRVFRDELSKEDAEWQEQEMPLYEFLREKMFAASTTALFGKEVFERYPDLVKYYWDFDNGVLARLFGVPKWIMPQAYTACDALIDRWEDWIKIRREKYGDEPGEEAEWGESWGAQVSRKRFRMYRHFDLSDRGMACFDLGYMFGLNSNAIPATGWTLAHLMKPSNKELTQHIRQEVDSAKKADGSIDINALVGMPYLNSAFHETLRMYVDVLVTRTLDEDFTLDDYHMSKGGIIIAPSYLAHHDIGPAWEQNNMPSETEWFGERFLVHDEKTGKVTFTTSGTNGRFFPFGGGAYICPGRVFAKQEVFGALAAFLLAFDTEFIEYLKPGPGRLIPQGKNEKGFPVVMKQFCGAGVVVQEGDTLLRLRRRKEYGAYQEP